MPRFNFLGGLLILLATLGAVAAMLYPPITGAAGGGTSMAEHALDRLTRFDSTDPVAMLIFFALGAGLVALLVHPDQKSVGVLLLTTVLCVRSFWVDAPGAIRAPEGSLPLTGFIIGLICSIVFTLGGPYPRGLRAHAWAFALGVVTLSVFSLLILKNRAATGVTGDIGLPVEFASWTVVQSTLSMSRFGICLCVWGTVAAAASIAITIALVGPREAFKA